MMTEILYSFMKKDWPEFKQLWFGALWDWLPFVIVSKKRLWAMYYGIADNAVYYTVKHPNTADMLKQDAESSQRKGVE